MVKAVLTTSQSYLTRPHRHHTCMVQSYSSGGASVTPSNICFPRPMWVHTPN